MNLKEWNLRLYQSAGDLSFPEETRTAADRPLVGKRANQKSVTTVFAERRNFAFFF